MYLYTSINPYGFGDSCKPFIRKLGKSLASNCLCGSYPSPVPSVQNKLPSKGRLPLNTVGSKESGQQIRKLFWLAVLTHSLHFPSAPAIECQIPLFTKEESRQPSFSPYSKVSCVYKVSSIIFLSISCRQGPYLNFFLLLN